MKVQPNEAAAKKFTRQYFNERKIVEKRYEYNYAFGDKPMMHIAFNIDVNFFMPAGVTITSILENNASLNFTFHIFTDAVDEKDLQRLKQTAEKYKQNCIVYVMDMEPFSNFHIKHARFKRVSFFRLYMPKILKKVTDKFLYIDADLICIGSMLPFFKIDMEGKILAAVSDLPEASRIRSAYLGLHSNEYFNSGSLWIDCNKWDDNNTTERCFAYQGVPAEKFTCHDQDVLNLVMDGNVKFISGKFNHLGDYGRKVPEGCIIYHFFGREKPWDIALTEYEKRWRKYLEISFWDNIENILPPKEPKNYHNYKRVAEIYYKEHNYASALAASLWYILLKTRFKFGL